MKIKYVELENYRQYKKEKINFSIDENKNFTIILGRNGFGKSNILNAVTWCLYGTEDHLKTTEEVNKRFPIVNIEVLENLKNGEQTFVKVSVNLVGEGEEYLVTRSLRVGKHSSGDNFIDETSNLEVMYREGKNWYTPYYNNPTVSINAILPKEIRQFFFFDGEKLRQHFEKDVNKKIKDAINKISQTDLIDKAIDRLDYLRDKIRKEIKSENPRTQEIQENMTRYKELIEGAQRKLKEELEPQYEETTDNLDKINQKLRKCNVELVEQLQAHREDLTGTQKDLEDKRRSMKEKLIDYLIQRAPFILAKESVDKTNEIIKQLIKKKLYPPPIDFDYLQKLLYEDKECICGTDISKGEHRDTVKKLLDIAKYSKYPAKEASFVLSRINANCSEFIDKMSEQRKDLIETDKKSQDTAKKLEEINYKLGEININEIKILESERRKFESARDDLTKDKAKYEIELKRYQTELERLNKEYDRELSKEIKYRNILLRKEVCDKSIESLQQIKKLLMNKIRLNIRKDTKDCFFKLITEKRETYKDVLIDENYNIEILHKSGFNALDTLSAGETQIFVLSFAAALRNASGFNAPLIIDTPLGKIDEEYRNDVSKILPKFLENVQVVLLVTSSEYTPQVRKNLSSRFTKDYEFKLEFNKNLEESKVIPYGK